MNTVIELLQNRVSSPKLTAPAPNSAELEQILACAVRAPDHARLKPWQFHVISGQALSKLGEIFARAVGEGVAQDKLDKCRNMPLRAPLMIVATCEPQENAKVPALEQFLAVGAAIQNMQVAISSLGYGSIWRTGEMAHLSEVKDAFGLSSAGEIVGFIYVGTPEKLPSKPVTNLSDCVKYWD
ncbi:MAG: nitroreductase [Gammaproteobacteria bacterium]|nr:nitroreductase [Gammaproteobacteria bacterium]